MLKAYVRIAAILGALSVILGAFAAHGLKKWLDQAAISVFETGVRYQFYHVFALTLVAILYKEYRNRWIEWSGVFFIMGIIFFSGSLYLLTYKAIAAVDGMRWVGPVTPVGGVFFITGWICLAVGIKK